MMSDIERYFDEEKFVTLECLSALGYTAKEIALYFSVSESAFESQASNPDSMISYHLRRGKLLARAEEDLALQASANSGDARAISLLSKVRYRKNFEAARRNLIYDCEVSDKTYSLIESYIESGCTDKLKPGEALYVELLSMINSMRRKYGRAKTIRFFQEAPFSFSYAQSRDMFEHSINLFYSDSKIEKKALRNLKAQQLEDAADTLLSIAREPKDFEIYERLITSSAKIRQLDELDPEPMPANTFAKPYKVYTLDPERIGIRRSNRNALAKQIDSIIGATEEEKRRARIDSGIDDIHFDDILDEHEKEAKS